MNISDNSSNTAAMRQHQKLKGMQSSTAATVREESCLKNQDVIDLRQSAVLNADSEKSSLGDILDSVCPEPMVSDTDEQLLLRFNFRSNVGVTQLTIHAPENMPEDASAPKTVKVFCDQTNMDFTDVDDLVPASVQEVEFVDGIATLRVGGPKFSRISSLQVLIEDNVDETDLTAINHFSVVGHVNPTYC